MELVCGLDRTSPEWITDNPKAAAIEFVKNNKNFIIQSPPFPFNESSISEPVTYWPSSYIKRVR
jgi:hypothetical protein